MNSTPAPVRDFFTPAALAAEWGWSEAGVRRACAAGEIPGARRFGGRWIIARAVLLQHFGMSSTPKEQAPAVASTPAEAGRPHRAPCASDLDRLFSGVDNPVRPV